MKFTLILGIGFGLAIAGWPVAAGADEYAARFGGFSAGINAGAAWGQSSYATNPNCPPGGASAVFCNAPPDPSAVNGLAVATSGSGTLSPHGFTGGVQAGYNWQAGTIVYGGEADIGLLRLRKTATANGNFPFLFAGTQYDVTDSISTDWLATLRGRFGVAVTPELLLYATGGAAFAHVKLSSSYADNAIGAPLPGGTGSASNGKTLVGWTVGGGAQWALDRNWSVKAEYLYADLGSVSTLVPLSNTSAFTQVISVSADVSVHLARIGLDYRF